MFVFRSVSAYFEIGRSLYYPNRGDYQGDIPSAELKSHMAPRSRCGEQGVETTHYEASEMGVLANESFRMMSIACHSVLEVSFYMSKDFV